MTSQADHPPLVEVAVPLPLPYALTYLVPASLSAQAEIGRRARVTVGRRKVTGVVVGLPETPPPGVKLREIDSILDRAPVIPPELLELGNWISEYYLAPLGEVLRGLTPPGENAWGNRRLWLTDAGALSIGQDPDEVEVIDALRELGRTSLAELQKLIAVADLDGVIGRLAAAGKLGLSTKSQRGRRFANAIELSTGTLEEHLETSGRSKQAHAVLRYLDQLGRPATVAEVCGQVGCGAGVIRRLDKLGVLRSFSQIERLELDQHMVAAGKATSPHRLRPDQQTAADAIVAATQSSTFRGILLRGVTGSGKTEVYLQGVTAALEQGRSAILLVPEIALVPALAGTLKERYGRALAIQHSGLSATERQQEWERVRQGEARVVLGPRSAVLAPVRRLGLIVVDEEQDGAYKQDKTPRYNGRDLALLRGRNEGATVVLVSATPSLESRLNAEVGKLGSLELTQRVGQGTMPEGILVNLREEGKPQRPGEVQFSDRLHQEIRKSLDSGEQVILLRNRRGYSPVLLCRACGEDLRCEDCGLPRTFHKKQRQLLCHYCGSKLPLPSECPSCSSTSLEPMGAGTERVEEEFKKLYPDISVDTLDRDTVRRSGGVATVLDRFGAGETQVLIGTQMVSKGHHFPNVSLAAVLQADTYLGFPDFRAVERTYNLLTQLAGRAGRGEQPGRIVIQTFNPDHYAIRAALAHDDRAFAAEEMRFRKVFHYPPYTRMVQLLVRDRSRERAAATIRQLAERIHQHELATSVRITGPAPAPFERLRGRWRFQLLIRSASAKRLRKLVLDATSEATPSEVLIDVDPYELL